MEGNNTPRQYIPLYCSQPSPTQLNSEAETALYYFPPIRDVGSTPLAPSIPTCYGPSRSQQIINEAEDELSDFSPIKEGNDPPLIPSITSHSRPHRPQVAQRGSRELPLSSKKKPSQPRQREQSNMGLGRTNILNTVDAIVPAKSTLKRNSGIQDVAHERPLKWQRIALLNEDNMGLVQLEIANLKERVEKVCAEAQDINRALQELLRKTEGEL